MGAATAIVYLDDVPPESGVWLEDETGDRERVAVVRGMGVLIPRGTGTRLIHDAPLSVAIQHVRRMDSTLISVLHYYIGSALLKNFVEKHEDSLLMRLLKRHCSKPE